MDGYANTDGDRSTLWWDSAMPLAILESMIGGTMVVTKLLSAEEEMLLSPLIMTYGI